MKKTGQRLLCLLLAVLTLLPGLCLVSRAEPDPGAQGAEEPVQNAETPSAPLQTEDTPVSFTYGGVAQPNVYCPQALCYDLAFDKTLLEKGADEPIAPAAFTKLMTALVAFEYRREAGDVSVEIREDMLSGSSRSGLRLKVGEVLPITSLLKGLVVANDNDAATSLAVVVSGSSAAFVDRMNARAAELGMTGTYYTNPTGVYDSLMHTTLRDTLSLCRALYRINDFMNFTSEERLSVPATNLSEERTFTNRNALIPFDAEKDYMIRGARGFIAGYTPLGGYVCATCRASGEANAIVLVSGGTDLSEAQDGSQISSYRDAAAILDWCRKEYAVTEVVVKETTVGEKKVRLSGGADHAVLVTESTLKALLPANLSDGDIRKELQLGSNTLDAPVRKGQECGEMALYWGDEKLGTVKLVAQANVPLSRWLQIWDGVSHFFSAGPARVFLIIVIFSAVVYLAALIITVYVQYRRNTRERRQVIQEIMERENRRLREIRKQERKQTQHRLRAARNAFQEGYRVFSGKSDALGSGKVVARVPERFRKPEAVQPPRQGQRRPSQSPPRRQGAPQGRQIRQTPQQTRRPARQQPRQVRRPAPPAQNRRSRPATRGDNQAHVQKWPD